MGLALHRSGDLSGAIEELRRALQLKPDWAPALAELSLLLAMRR
jgi:Flp pilus assembly protein TadD